MSDTHESSLRGIVESQSEAEGLHKSDLVRSRFSANHDLKRGRAVVLEPVFEDLSDCSANGVAGGDIVGGLDLTECLLPGRHVLHVDVADVFLVADALSFEVLQKARLQSVVKWLNAPVTLDPILEAAIGWRIASALDLATLFRASYLTWGLRLGWLQEIPKRKQSRIAVRFFGKWASTMSSSTAGVVSVNRP